MNINIVFIIALMILVAYSIDGFRKGLVKGIMCVVSYVLGIVVLGILIKGAGNVMQKSWMNVLMALILLALIRVIYRVLKLILDSCRLVSKLPVIKWVDKTAGIFLGMAQGVCLIWILFILFGCFDFMNLNTWIMSQVAESSLLKLLYHSNYIVHLLQAI